MTPEIVSASTLTRRARKAEKAGKKSAAEQLRKRAAKARRDERAAKAMPGLGGAEITRIVENVRQRRAKRYQAHPGNPIPLGAIGDARVSSAGVEETAAKMDRAIAKGEHSGIVVGLSPVHMQVDEAANDGFPPKPWWERDDQIAELMKTRNPERFKLALGAMVAAARNDMMRIQSDKQIEASKELNEVWKINFVSGFIARMDAEGRANGGPLPAAMVVDGVTLARVVDALRKAGHTADGVTGMRRAVGR